jgi:hypothetical protein
MSTSLHESPHMIIKQTQTMAPTTKTFTCILLPPWDHDETICTQALELARWTSKLGGETVDQYTPSVLLALSDWMARAQSGDAVFLNEDLKMKDVDREFADFELVCN